MLDTVNINTIDTIFENLCILLLSKRFVAEEDVSFIDAFVFLFAFLLNTCFLKKSRAFVILQITMNAEKSETSNGDESDLYVEDEKEEQSTTYFSPFRDHFFDLIKRYVNSKLSSSVKINEVNIFYLVS